MKEAKFSFPDISLGFSPARRDLLKDKFNLEQLLFGLLPCIFCHHHARLLQSCSTKNVNLLFIFLILKLNKNWQHVVQSWTISPSIKKLSIFEISLFIRKAYLIMYLLCGTKRSQHHLNLLLQNFLPVHKVNELKAL